MIQRDLKELNRSYRSDSDAVSVTPKRSLISAHGLERSDNPGIAIWKLVKR